MRLQLDSDWLRSPWPEIFDYQEGVYLYLQAPPLTSVLSHQFKWLGSGGHPGSGENRISREAAECPRIIRAHNDKRTE